jgi:hypothetical protein
MSKPTVSPAAAPPLPSFSGAFEAGLAIDGGMHYLASLFFGNLRGCDAAHPSR